MLCVWKLSIPGVIQAQVVLEAEISREQIPLRNAYKHIGQKASVRVNSGIDTVLPGDSCSDKYSHNFIKGQELSLRTKLRF